LFTISDTARNHTCSGYSRRDFLRIGALGAGGLTLANLLGVKARAAQSGSPAFLKDKSVVLLFLHGGPPHIETFDPKMTAPVEIRRLTGEVKTCLPGVTFGGTFPRMAKIADRLAVVRSYGSNNADHTYGDVVTAKNALKASASSIYARVAGTNHPKTGMPRNAHVLPESVQPGLKLGSNFETGALPTVVTAGDLGPAYAAFNTAGGGNLNRDMQLAIPAHRFDDRRSLLKQLDTLRRHVDATGAMDGTDRFQQQAYDVITGGVADAFDLSKEDPRTVERYDTSKMFDVAQLNKWFDMKRASNQLGKQMLMARRLCEAGCGFVTVSDCGWDYHANNNSPAYMAGIHPMGNQVDQAVAAFVQDLADRGLTDKILLIVTSEMGRTPRLNKNGGRDHYAKLTPLVFAGGGLKMGQVIGQSDRIAAEPVTEAYGPENLMATIMNTLFDTGEARIATGIPNGVAKVITDGKPIRELF
jgi:uncharacterized protein (DUF1501 family)